jgi:peroxiredoxin
MVQPRNKPRKKEEKRLMRRAAVFISLFLVLAAGPRVEAGDSNDVLDIGDPAPAWTNLPGVDGKKHSLADLSDKQVVVLVFTCNSCPIASDYEDRIIAFAKASAGSEQPTAVVAINVNTIEEDRLPKMKERAQSKGFPYPYLFDQTQKIAKAYGAVYTPEFFILDKDRKVAYRGAFDDNIEPTKVKRQYVEPAVKSLLKGEKPNPARTNASGGCLIRYERGRRRKAGGK